MSEENFSHEFRLKNIDETRNYLIEEINRNELVRNVEHSLILASTITGCLSIFTFASLVGIPIRITSSAIGLKIRAITTGVIKCKSIIKKKKKKHNKIVLLAKSYLNSIEVSISKAFINLLLAMMNLF